MVRLKERMPRPIRRSPRYFNSTMVRLKEGAQFNQDPVLSFQFHYGTIKSLTLEKNIRPHF